MRTVQSSLRNVVGASVRAARPGTRPGTVDVWRADLVLPPRELSRISRCLSDDERLRVARFHFQRDRDRFLASRGLLRHLLASYLSGPPGEIRFGYGPQGKPFLLDHPDLRFNLSHAADVLLVAVATGRELGVDVEQVFSEAVMNEVSGAVLSQPERVALERLEPGERRRWFVRLWTRKEAYIKADGRGMSIQLQSIDVSTSLGRVRHQGHATDDWTSSPRWAVRELEVAPGYAGALVAEGLDWEVGYFDWPPDRR